MLKYLICPIAVPLLTLATLDHKLKQMSNRWSLWHRRCCAYTRAAVITLLTHATTLVVTQQHTLRWSPWFNFVKKTDAIGYIPNQTNEYLYPQSILTYTQVCTHYTQVTHGRAPRYTQECKCCATRVYRGTPKGGNSDSHR